MPVFYRDELSFQAMLCWCPVCGTETQQCVVHDAATHSQTSWCNDCLRPDSAAEAPLSPSRHAAIEAVPA